MILNCDLCSNDAEKSELSYAHAKRRSLMTRLLKSALAAFAVTIAFTGCGTEPTLPGAKELVGQDGAKGFQYRTLVRGMHVRKYGVFVPMTYRPTKKYPVIVFLHGI